MPFNGVLSGFKVQWEFEESFKGISRMFQGCCKVELGLFLETFKGDSRELQGYLKEIQRVFQGTFKALSKRYQGSFKGV